MKNGRSNRRTGSPLNKFIRCSIKWSQNATQTTTVSTNISVPNQEVSANKNVQTPLSQILKKRWKTQMTFFSITTLKFLWQDWYFSGFSSHHYITEGGESNSKYINSGFKIAMMKVCIPLHPLSEMCWISSFLM